MQIAFTAHSCAETEIEISVTHNGKLMTAKAPGLVVELVADDGSSTLTRRYVPDDMAADLALFAPGSPVVATFAKPAA